MKTWGQATKEDILTDLPIQDVYDMAKVADLSRNSAIQKIEDLMELGVHDDVPVARDQIRQLAADIYIDFIHVTQDRYPDPEEIGEYLKDPRTIEACQKLVYLCTNVTEENWPEVKERLLAFDTFRMGII